MKLPTRLISVKSQVTVSALAFALYAFCSLCFPYEWIVKWKMIPFTIALLLAWVFQDVKPATEVSRIFGVTVLNGLIIFVHAYGFSFIVPTAVLGTGVRLMSSQSANSGWLFQILRPW